MASDSIRFVVLAYARHRPTLKLINKIRENVPTARIQVFLDHPRPDSNQITVQHHLELLNDLKSMASEDLLLELVAREYNLGTSLNLLDALDRIQSSCDGYVVLEDDCDPAPLFFDFARRALKFLHQEAKSKAVMFSGANHLLPPLSSFSRSAFVTPLSHVWGWGGLTASLPDLSQFIRTGPTLDEREKLGLFIRTFVPYAPYRNHWDALLDSNWDDLSWDYRLQFWIWARGYLCLISGVNLVRNTGFDSVATNSESIPDHYQNKVAKRYTMHRQIRLNQKFLIWWELTGYRGYALVRLIRIGLFRRGLGES